MRFFFAVTTLIFICVTSQNLFSSTVTYTYSISPLKKEGNNGFRICIGFKSFTNQTIFNFPLVWGSDQITEYIQVDSVSGSTNHILEQGSPSKLTIQHVKGRQIQIYYTVQNVIQEETFTGRDSFFPLIHEDCFYFFSNSVTLIPDTQALCNFRISWVDYCLTYANFPITSIGSGFKQEMKQVKPTDFQNLVICGGDFRVYEKGITSTENIKLAIRGNWNFEDTAMMGMITNTIRYQRSFWDDHSTPQYLVVIVPVLAASEYDMSFQGTGLLNSFTVAVTENKNTSPSALGYLFHHELMHHWIGSKIQNAKDEELSYWFSEGFTDYFARMNMFSCGLMNKNEYTRTLDSLFSVHYGNSLHLSHNDSIKVHFWDNRIYEKLPYNRGALFAYYIDLLIQSKTEGKQSLKNVMQRMLKQSLKEPKPFDTIWFTKTLKEVCGENISAELKRFMINGEFIPIEMWNHISPGLVALTEVKVFDLGFEVNTKEIEKGSIVTNVKTGTGAEEAGLKTGDVLQGFSVYYGRSDYEAELNVLRKEKAIDIKFYPFARSRVPQHTKD